MTARRALTLSIESTCLLDNPLGDPHTRRVYVLLPPDYDERASPGYPVIYLLCGWGGRGAVYLNDLGVFAGSMPEHLFSSMQSGGRPAIVVIPDCSTRFGGSQYIDSGGTGPYMQFLCEEIVPFVDGRLNTRADRAFRGVMGHSSGGFGALVTAMKRPDLFSCVMSSAGDCWFEFLYVHSLHWTLSTLRRAGGVAAFVERYLGCPNPRAVFGRKEELTMLNLSMCPCFAPNPAAPVLKGDLYFDLETGALVPEVWSRFLAWDPIRLVEPHRDALRSLAWIHLEAARDDEYGLFYGHRQLAHSMHRHGLRPVVDEYDGRHGGHHYRVPMRVQRMLSAMPR